MHRDLGLGSPVAGGCHNPHNLCSVRCICLWCSDIQQSFQAISHTRSLMSGSPLDTALNYRVQAKEKHHECTRSWMPPGYVTLSMGAELINMWTARQIGAFPCTGSNVSGLLWACFIVTLPSFHWSLPLTGLRELIICSLHPVMLAQISPWTGLWPLLTNTFSQ